MKLSVSMRQFFGAGAVLAAAVIGCQTCPQCQTQSVDAQPFSDSTVPQMVLPYDEPGTALDATPVPHPIAAPDAIPAPSASAIPQQRVIKGPVLQQPEPIPALDAPAPIPPAADGELPVPSAGLNKIRPICFEVACGSCAPSCSVSCDPCCPTTCSPCGRVSLLGRLRNKVYQIKGGVHCFKARVRSKLSRLNPFRASSCCTPCCDPCVSSCVVSDCCDPCFDCCDPCMTCDTVVGCNTCPVSAPIGFAPQQSFGGYGAPTWQPGHQHHGHGQAPCPCQAGQAHGHAGYGQQFQGYAAQQQGQYVPQQQHSQLGQQNSAYAQQGYGQQGFGQQAPQGYGRQVYAQPQQQYGYAQPQQGHGQQPYQTQQQFQAPQQPAQQQPQPVIQSQPGSDVSKTNYEVLAPGYSRRVRATLAERIANVR